MRLPAFRPTLAAPVLGAHLQPPWTFPPSLEGAFSIGYLDTHGRGFNLKASVSDSPSSPAADRVFDAYLGAN